MNIKRRQILVALVVGGLGAAAPLHAAGLAVEQAWARPTVQGQSGGGGFLTISNPGGPADRLLSAHADVANVVELHTMTMQGDVMNMRKVDGIEVPAGQTVQLKPGGLHIMFMGLKAPLKNGSSFPLKLRFERAGEMTVQMAVRLQPEPAAKPASRP